MTRRILIIQAHPSSESFCSALAQAYLEGAQASGASAQLLDLASLSFDPILHGGYRGEQPLEADLARAQELISWADHLAFVYPTWWGGAPALLKGFIDRVFLPGFAFRYHAKSPFPEKLLAGRTGEILVTMDTPPWYNWLVLGAPGHRLMRESILGFCGIKVRRAHSIGVVRGSTPEQRATWLVRARQAGAKAATAKAGGQRSNSRASAAR